MNKKYDLLGIILAVLSGIFMLALMLVRAFSPAIILPNLDFLTVLLLSLLSLVLDHYLTGGSKRVYWLIPLYAFVIFGVFPWVACLVPLLSAVKLAVMGAVVFTAVTYIFDSIINRLSSGAVAKFAPLISAFGLYLAAQCFMGIF